MPLDLPLLVPAIRLDHPDPEAEAARARSRAQAPWCAGFLLFGGDVDSVRRLTRELREIAGRDLLIASDMERGAGQQVRGLRELPGPGLLGFAGSVADAEAAGRMTAEDALSVGVDVIFAPVVDVMSEIRNPIIGARSFGWDPGQVAAFGRAFCRGVRRAGALPVLKHYPGHGATRLDSHVDRPVVEATREELEVRDLVPFDAALRAGDARAVMTAHVAFPALDPEDRIATFSSRILDHLRRTAAPREAVAVTDALLMEGAAGGIGTTEAARRALEAGCDLLLYAGDEEVVAAGLTGGEKAEAAASRVAGWLAERAQPAATPSRGDGGLTQRLAERAVERALPRLGEVRSVLVLDDDDHPNRGFPIRDAALRAGARVELRGLGEAGLPDPEVIAATDLIVLLATVTLGKGDFGLRHGAPLLAQMASIEAPPHLISVGAWVPPAVAFLPGIHPLLVGALAAKIFPQGT